MKNSKRLLATLLTLCVMASFAFTGTAFAADEADVTLALPAQIVNVNGTAQVVLAGATADEYISSDTSVATVDANGVVTGMAIGRVTITAKNGGAEIATVDIPVVGENLFNSRGVDNGSFAGGNASLFKAQFARFNHGWTNFCKSESFWAATTESAYAETAEVVTKASAINANANVLKYSRTTEATNKQIAIRTSEFMHKDGYQYGAYPMDNEKLYEFTGWMNFDEMTNAPAVVGRVNHGTTPNDTTQIAAYGQMASSYGSDSKTSDIAGWQYFNTSAYDMHLIPDDVQLYAVPQLSSGKSAWTGDFYFADASFHEVKYDPSFTSNSGLSNAKVGFETSTQFKHLSNTGKEIVSYNASGTKQAISVTYESLDKNVATVDSSGNITAVGAGTAIITATATAGGQTVTRTITFDVEKDVVDAFTPEKTDADYDEPTVIAISKEGVDNITSEPNGDGTHTVIAPARNKAGKKFLYWAKGLTAQKKILLYKTNELTDYLPDEKYANYLIPVYEDDISAPEYYNANGQLIPNVGQNDRVTMPGYGTSNGWQKYGENIYVATYALDKPAKNIVITTTNCTTDEDKYGYGDLVTCTPNGTGTFKCWKKNGEIVSVDPTYTFKAWESCPVEAVYVDRNFQYTGSKMKIIIDSFDVDAETGVMAEFIGLSGAVEKGIMFTDEESGKKTNIAMTTKGSQFSVIADNAGTYVGYAILRNGDAYTLITDGEYIHN